MGNVSPVPSPVAHMMQHRNHLNSQGHQMQHHAMHQQQQQQLQNPALISHAAATTAAANIPEIIFSDYSSREFSTGNIFDTLDLDLGQIDEPGLQMLSDHNPIMIADPTIEDGFRRDLN